MNVDLTQLPGVAVGRVVGTEDGKPLVQHNGGAAHRASVVWMPNAPDWSSCRGLRVALAFAEGDSARPLVLGLIDPPPRSKTSPETLRIESGRELVIECGKAKIALRADGRIEIRGGHLISRSSGPNKIKGGSVHIN